MSQYIATLTAALTAMLGRLTLSYNVGKRRFDKKLVLTCIIINLYYFATLLFVNPNVASVDVISELATKRC